MFPASTANAWSFRPNAQLDGGVWEQISSHGPGQLPYPCIGVAMAATPYFIWMYSGFSAFARTMLHGVWGTVPYNDGLWWTRIQPNQSPFGRFSHTTVRMSEAMWVFGGFPGLYETTSELWRLDLNIWSWTQVFNVAAPGMAGHSAVAYQEELMVVFGGFYATEGGNYTLYDSIWVSVGWVLGEKNKRRLFRFLWFVIGTRYSSPSQNTDFKTHSRTHTHTHTHTHTYTHTRTHTHTHTRTHTRTHTHSTPAHTILTPTRLQEFTPSSSTWQLIPSSNGPSARFYHTASLDSYTHLMYVFGGQDNTRYYNDTYAWDVVAHTWHYIAATGAVPQPRSQHCSGILLSGSTYKMYVWGGWDGVQLFGQGGSLSVLDLQTYVWKYIPMTTGPPAKFSASRCVKDIGFCANC